MSESEPFGHYNEFPAKYDLIDIEEWVRQLALANIYTNTTKTHHKQCPLPPEIGGEEVKTTSIRWNVVIYASRLSAVGIAKLHTYHVDEDQARYAWARHGACRFFPGKWKPTEGHFAFFFMVGCQHPAWTELTPTQAREAGHDHYGNCYHVVQCNECGFIWSYDSSG